ncbi:cyclin-dependent kinase, partial [Trifolium pratense]
SPCYDPARMATTMELLHDKYFNKEPLPVPVSELRVPLTRNTKDEDSVELVPVSPYSFLELDGFE